MTKKTKTTATTAKVVPMRKELPSASSAISFDDKALKSLSILAASIMFQAPQFATQTNPQNILGLADIMYKYALGEITVTQPQAEDMSKKDA